MLDAWKPVRLVESYHLVGFGLGDGTYPLYLGITGVGIVCMGGLNLFGESQFETMLFLNPWGEMTEGGALAFSIIIKLYCLRWTLMLVVYCRLWR